MCRLTLKILLTLELVIEINEKVKSSSFLAYPKTAFVERIPLTSMNNNNNIIFIVLLRQIFHILFSGLHSHYTKLSNLYFHYIKKQNKISLTRLYL